MTYSFSYLEPVCCSIYAAIKDLPIIDAHNHCDVKSLSEDRNFTDIWEAEAATDHYVWECFRKCGVPEELLTGKTTNNYDKWMAVAKAFPEIAGNPTYECTGSIGGPGGSHKSQST